MNQSAHVCISIACRDVDSIALISRCVKSCLGQCENLIIWIQIDGTNPQIMLDHLNDLKQHYETDGVRFVIRATREQGGGAVSRNEALAWMDEGWLINLMDSDDWLPENSVQSRLDVLIDDLLWVAGRMRLTENNIRTLFPCAIPEGLTTPEETLKYLHSELASPGPTTLLAPVEAWWKTGGIIGLCYGKEDVTTTGLLLQGNGLVIPNIVYEYERLPTGETRHRTPERQAERDATRRMWRYRTGTLPECPSA